MGWRPGDLPRLRANQRPQRRVHTVKRGGGFEGAGITVDKHQDEYGPLGIVYLFTFVVVVVAAMAFVVACFLVGLAHLIGTVVQ